VIPNILTRTSPHRARWLWAGGLLIALAALIAAACNGDGQQAPTESISTPSALGQDELVPQIVSSDLAVGPNRFVLGLLTLDNELILNAQVRLRFFKADDEAPKAEVDATPIRITKTYTETHADGTVHTHEAGETGVYVANLELDAAGQWRVEVNATIEGEALEPATVPFTVREESLSPAIGDPAPQSRQLTLADVDDITDIDTSDPPNPDMHTTTIADAVTSGKPVVIAFTTPAFCLSRLCGPAKQVVDQLYEQHKDRVTFVHVEPYFLDRARSGEGLVAVPTVEEWGLISEPWIFVVDEEGKIAAKFEAMVTAEEIEGTLQDRLGASGDG
jgi:hypothetical protein